MFLFHFIWRSIRSDVTGAEGWRGPSGAQCQHRTLIIRGKYLGPLIKYFSLLESCFVCSKEEKGWKREQVFHFVNNILVNCWSQSQVSYSTTIWLWWFHDITVFSSPQRTESIWMWIRCTFTVSHLQFSVLLCEVTVPSLKEPDGEVTTLRAEDVSFLSVWTKTYSAWRLFNC